MSKFASLREGAQCLRGVLEPEWVRKLTSGSMHVYVSGYIHMYLMSSIHTHTYPKSVVHIHTLCQLYAYISYVCCYIHIHFSYVRT